jgi:hypothetical protein
MVVVEMMVLGGVAVAGLVLALSSIACIMALNQFPE